MRCRSERGVALVVALLAMLLMSALGAALVLITASETLIAGRFRQAQQALDAADAALERAVGDLAMAPDWNGLLDGSVRSSFVDGAPDGPRTIDGGAAVDLTAVRNLASCGRTSACSIAEMDRISPARPWGANNPRWRLYAYGPLERLLPPGVVESPFYVVVLVGDDPAETDGDPLHDGLGKANPGAGVLALRAEAFGPRGVHAVAEMTVARRRAPAREGAATPAAAPNQPATIPPARPPGRALTLDPLRVLSWRR